FDSLREEQRKFDRQMDGFVFSTVITQLPLRNILVESHLQGERRKAGFDISGSGSAVTRSDISPVSLLIDHQAFLPQFDQRVAERLVSMEMVLHVLNDNVGHLVKPAVIHLVHGVEDPALYGLQTVLDGRNSPLQNDV